MSDAQLRANIAANKSKKEKYQKVRNSISWNSLTYQRNLSAIDDWIEKCQDAVDKIDGNEGYFYLSEMREKLETDIKTMQKYRDYVSDANTSFINLYEDLGDKISDLNDQIDRDRSAYNDGKMFWEWIW